MGPERLRGRPGRPGRADRRAGSLHLLVAITPHGFGHAAQVAPVVNALRARLPATRVTLMTTVPEWFLRQRISGEFELWQRAADFGLMMDSALAVDLERSAGAYAALHAGWDASVSEEARMLQSLAPDLVLADVPCLPLAGAARAGIPAVALCSLNWADIYRHYFGGREEAPRVLADMEAAYNGAAAFVCPAPSMAMPSLVRKIAVGPIATRGVNRRQALDGRLDIGPGTSLVAVAPGGVQTRFPMEHWVAGEGIHWLVSEAWKVRHPRVSTFERCGLSFTDIVASCDAVLGKCGYGTVTECVVNGTPLLYVPRPDWPEEQALLGWLNQHRAGVAVPPERLLSGAFGDILGQARALHTMRSDAAGAEEAADILYRFLQRG